MRNLTCLEDYTIASDDSRNEIPRIHEAWATFAPNLRRFWLFMEAGSFHTFIPPPGVQCTNLRRLRLSSTVQNLLDANIPLRLTPVCEFINGLHETLEELYIDEIYFLRLIGYFNNSTTSNTFIP
ncbi:hypothetical protein BD779DRAFT_1672881 [Infundibulicybe gibba]|nr:hypothetical protein BD779DRAFT_1672881 [Infundibulicybe gibba]